MILNDLPPAALSERLANTGVGLDIGSYRVHLRTDVAPLAEEITRQYGGYPIETEPAIHDFFLRISPPSRLRRHVRPNVCAYIDELDPFEPMPRRLAYPLFESAINWCVAVQISRHLLLHAAVMAHRGRAVIFPAPSGSGKSTLSALLSLAGWRLLSDEFAILRAADGLLQASPRPISLKNDSIDIIAEAGGAERLSQRFDGTIKGTLAYLRTQGESLDALETPCTPTLVVLPTYKREATLSVEPIEKSEAFMHLIDNAVNYLLLGRTGFEILTSVVERSRAYRLEYSNNEEAIAALEALLDDAAPARQAATA